MATRRLYPQEMLKIHEASQNKIGEKFPAESPEVTIVLLSYERVGMTKRCIESCFEHAGYPFKMLVFDNGSTQAAVDELKPFLANYPEITFYENGENLGSSNGRNAAFSLVKTPYILSLDNDTICHPNFLVEAMKVALIKDCSFVSPMRLNLDGSVWDLGMELELNDETGMINYLRWFHDMAPNQVEAWMAGGEFQTNSVSGGVMLLKRDAFWDCGGFAALEAGIWMGDIDISIRIKQTGHEIWTAHRSMITHDDEWKPLSEADKEYVRFRYDLKKLQQSDDFIKERYGKSAVSDGLIQNMQDRLTKKLGIGDES